jgi:hypothetical protein
MTESLANQPLSGVEARSRIVGGCILASYGLLLVWPMLFLSAAMLATDAPGADRVFGHELLLAYSVAFGFIPLLTHALARKAERAGRRRLAIGVALFPPALFALTVGIAMAGS